MTWVSGISYCKGKKAEAWTVNCCEVWSCTSVTTDESENADFLTIKLEVYGRCIHLTLIRGPQEKVPKSTQGTFWHNIRINESQISS